jgi:hypothetical protein
VSRSGLTDVATIGLGAVYVVAGVAETIRAVTSGDGGVPFWLGTLVGGGTAILVGILVFRDRPRVYGPLVVLGCLSGVLATMWTLVVPLVALAVIALTIKRTADEAGHAAQ